MTFGLGGPDTLGDAPIGDGNVAHADAPIGDGPCSPWITTQQLAGSDSGLDADPTKIQAAVDVASFVMYAATGRKYAGSCTVRLRPCCCDCLSQVPYGFWRSWGYDALWSGLFSGAGVPPWVPDIVAGQWYNVGVGGQSRCRPYVCGSVLDRLDLGLFPVTSTVVTISGEVLPATAYRIDRNRYLTRVDGTAWPETNNLTGDENDTGVWRVDVTYGMSPPEACVFAALELGTELLKHGNPNGQCKLPLRTTQVNRQGVNYSLTNVMEIVKEGGTGLYWVDLVVNAANPNKLLARPRVLIPGRLRPGHQPVGRFGV